MIIHFWGTRGSIPTPLSPEQIQSKIIAAIERISPKDIETQDARMRFVASLPPWLFGTVGGNSPCVGISFQNGAKFILDAGSGLRELGLHDSPPKNLRYTMFFSHFHWDHMQGIPFFNPAYNPKAHIDVYSAFPAAETILSRQNACPYFPVNARWENMKSHFTFHLVHNGETFFVDDIKVSVKKMGHPGNSYSYSFEEDGKKFIYATDVELVEKDFDRTVEENFFFENADVLVLDSQYNADELSRKKGWGHNIFSRAVDFANTWHAKKLYLFHHEPTYNDQKIYTILQAARWYKDSCENQGMKIYLAVEGQEVEL